ncbi:MAG: rod shape-determining protein MreC, partial [uncultured bacterium]
LFFVLFSIFLLIFDKHSIKFHALQSRVKSIVALPFQFAVDAPIRLVHWANLNLTTQHNLANQNLKLQTQVILLEAQLQKLMALENENTELRQLLQSASTIDGKVRVARLLVVSLDPNLQQMIIDQGSDKHVKIGQPVLDANGVMGEIVEVGPYTSKGLLITDTRSAIPVEDIKDQERAIALGTGSSGELALVNVPEISQITVGDKFVTSGLDMRYPAGYSVGVVTNIKYNKNTHMREITLSPSAQINRADQVLLASPNKNKLRKIVKKQLQETLPTAQNSAQKSVK